MKLFIDFSRAPLATRVPPFNDRMSLSALRIENDDGEHVYTQIPEQQIEPGDTVEIAFPGIVVHIRDDADASG